VLDFTRGYNSESIVLLVLTYLITYICLFTYLLIIYLFLYLDIYLLRYLLIYFLIYLTHMLSKTGPFVKVYNSRIRRRKVNCASEIFSALSGVRLVVMTFITLK